MHFQMKFLLFALLLFPLGAVADQDSDYLAARDAFRAGNAVRFESYAARLKNSPLEPYLAYYRLRLQLETADAATIQKFLTRPDDTPVIDRLRGEWLKLLGKNHQWEAFAAEYPHLLNEDTELNCYALQMRRRTQENEALQEARKLWLSGNDDLPESCTPLFEAALGSGVISEADVWLRMRLALEAGNVSLARKLSAKLPLERRLSAVGLGNAAADPAALSQQGQAGQCQRSRTQGGAVRFATTCQTIAAISLCAVGENFVVFQFGGAALFLCMVRL